MMILTSLDLMIELTREFPNVNWRPGDAIYAVVKESSLSRLGKTMGVVGFAVGIFGWKKWFDCNRWARFAHFCADCMVGRNGTNPGYESVAFGQVWYIKDNGTGHAINWVRTENGIRTWEPQTKQFVTLSESERLSASWGAA